MEPANVRKLLDALMSCRTGAEARSILQSIGDSDVSTLDVPFGPHELVWHAFGNTSSNISTINLGTNPGRSFTERITNAFDAILEDRVVEGVVPPGSPRLAATQWFGRPASSADAGLFSWKSRPDGIDRKVQTVICGSDKESAPTLDIHDSGVGILAEDFADTILSLQHGNKIKKKYLIGAFGQGGSATLAFCEYAIIFSRSHANPSRIAFTIVRVLRLDASYKEDCYAYLTHIAASGTQPQVFDCEIGADPIDLYPDFEAAKVASFLHGTVVRHICYRLTNLDKGLQAIPGNLYHFLHFSMFDPLLPFRLIDLRPKTPKNEYVGGSRNRLMAHARAKEAATPSEEDDSTVQLVHFRPMEFIVPSTSADASIGVEYWVVFAERKKGDEYHLRSHSNELFVQQGLPIVGTLNGQNQGEYSASLLKQLGLNLLSRHIVIHIDATAADSPTRRELFSSSREGFKGGPVLENLLSVLRKILSEDERLFELEKELTERITNRESESTKSEVKREVSRLLKDAGLDIKEEGYVEKEGQGEKEKVKREGKRGPRHSEPLPTLPFPQVTKFEIVYPSDICVVRLEDSQSVIVETDADAAYDKHVAIRSEPPLLDVVTKAPLRGGRIRWRLRPNSAAIVGATGEVIATLTRPNGSQLSSKVLFEIAPAEEKESKKAKGWVPPFDILPVSPDMDETWTALWSDDGDDEKQQARHAYKVLRAGGKVTVYYSTAFQPFREALDKLKMTKPARVSIFEMNYQIWIGYHAILQEQQESPESAGLHEAAVEILREEERQTVGHVQVKQSLRNAEVLETKAVAAEVMS